jgi:hypothetical protein
MNLATSIASRILGALAGAALGRIIQVALVLALPHEHRWIFGGDIATCGLPLLGALYGVLVGPMLRDRPAGARRRVGLGAGALLIGLGGAFLGATFGEALHGLASALLAARDLDFRLDDRAIVQAFGAVAGLFGFAAALILMARWRAADPETSRGVGVRLVLIVALGALGGGWAGHYLGYAAGVVITELLAITGADFKDMVILFTIAGTFALFAGTIWLTLRMLRPGWSFQLRLGHAALAVPLALVLASGAMALSRRLDDRDVGRQPLIFFEIRLPAGVAPAREAVTVAFTTEHGSEPVALYREAARDGDRVVLKGAIKSEVRHPARRIVTLAIAGAPTRHFDLRLPRRPKTGRANGPWQRVDHHDTIGHAADAGDDSAIRFHAWKP